MAKKIGKAAGGTVSSSKTGGGKQQKAPQTAKSKPAKKIGGGRVRSSGSY